MGGDFTCPIITTRPNKMMMIKKIKVNRLQSMGSP